MPIFLRSAGAAYLAIGLVGAFYGPLEIYVFYLFSESGRFSYPGFGFGSLWFAALAIMNLGYYLVAAMFIPAGIGHLKLRRWALPLTRLYLWFWLGFGLLLTGNFLLLAPSIARSAPKLAAQPVQSVNLGIAAVAGLIFLPGLALWLYHSKMVRTAFEAHDPNPSWINRYPFTVLALLILYGLMIIVLHGAIFFQGLFPLFGQILLGRQSAYWITGCILALGILIYGTLRLEKWAWWGAVAYLSLLAPSTLLSFAQHSLLEILQVMDLPAAEWQVLNRLAFLGDTYLAGLLAPPLLAGLGLLLYSRRYFGIGSVPGSPFAR